MTVVKLSSHFLKSDSFVLSLRMKIQRDSKSWVKVTSFSFFPLLYLFFAPLHFTFSFPLNINLFSFCYSPFVLSSTALAISPSTLSYLLYSPSLLSSHLLSPLVPLSSVPLISPLPLLASHYFLTVYINTTSLSCRNWCLPEVIFSEIVQTG